MATRIRWRLNLLRCCAMCSYLAIGVPSFAQLARVDLVNAPSWATSGELPNNSGNALEPVTAAANALAAKEPRTASHTEILAWSAKVYRGQYPPRLREEVLALVQWNDKTWSLLCLEREPKSPLPNREAWNKPPGPWGGRASRWRSDFPAKPTQAETVRFVHGTKFGNNEYNPEFTVLAVLLYEKDWKDLRQELATGIDSKEKQVRRSQSINPVKFPATQ